MNHLRTTRQLLSTTLAVFGLAVGLGMTGCGTTSPTRGFSTPEGGQVGEARLRNGDQIQIRLETSNVQLAQTIDIAIDENGEISLPLVGRVKAAGLTASELGEHIQANYVPRYFVRCNATVLTTVRFIYVGGEVRATSKYPWSDDMTLLKAINTAGGFSDYASRRKVEVTRGKVKLVFDCEDLRQNPERDVPLQPGDSVYVPRSIF